MLAISVLSNEALQSLLTSNKIILSVAGFVALFSILEDEFEKGQVKRSARAVAFLGKFERIGIGRGFDFGRGRLRYRLQRRACLLGALERTPAPGGGARDCKIEFELRAQTK